MTATGPKTSSTLLVRLRDLGDAVHWNLFIDLYGPIVYRLIKRHDLPRAVAEDLVQEFFAVCVRHLPNFRLDETRGGFRKWVITVTLNLVRRYFRDRGRKRPPLSLDAIGEGVLEPLPASEVNGFDDWVAGAEAARLIQMAFDELGKEISPAHLDVFRQLVLEQRKPTEVAAAFGMNRNQVDGIKFRNLQRIRAIAHRLQQECLGE